MAETPITQRAGEFAYNTLNALAETFQEDEKSKESREGEETMRSIDIAMQRMERDMSFLDDRAGLAPQLTNTELVLLTATVGIAFGSPYLLSMKLVEVLVPSMSALTAAIGFSAVTVTL